MARYDRLGPLAVPPRERAFPGWYLLRDLEGHERDAELSRRARVRFLVARVLRRLAAGGLDAVPEESLARQLDAVREELGQLSARDPERLLVARQLHDLREGRPEAAMTAALTLSEWHRQSHSTYAAEEFARIAVDLAESAERTRAVSVATRGVARALLTAGLVDSAREQAERACVLALEGDDRVGWVDAMAELAATYRAAGDNPKAAEVLGMAVRRAREWNDERATGHALLAQTEHELESGNAAAGVDLGWSALRVLHDRGDRLAALSLLARCFTRLGLHRAAARCHEIRQKHVAETTERARVAVALAQSYAAAGDQARVRATGTAAVKELNAVSTRIRTGLLLDLAVAYVQAGGADTGRELLREAINLARRDHADPELQRAEELLGSLEKQVDVDLDPPEPVPATPTALRIAAEIERANEGVVFAN